MVAKMIYYVVALQWTMLIPYMDYLIISSNISMR